jgi:hypothetical protein
MVEKINIVHLLLYSVYKIEFVYILNIVMQQTLQQSETKLTLLHILRSLSQISTVSEEKI